MKESCERELLPRFENDRPPILRGFHCGNCGWSYTRRRQQCDYWELLAEVRELFEVHECGDHQEQLPRS